jgi:oligopeptide transport system permease protein
MPQSVVSLSPTRLALRRLRRNRIAMAGAAAVALFALAGIIGPWVSSHHYNDQDADCRHQPPSGRHLMGTDDLGRDVLSRVLYGARISLAVGVAATAVSLVIGVAYGAIAGYVGGRLGNAMMRLVDVLYGLPYMLFVILIMMYVEQSLIALFVALGAVQWLTMARIVRGQMLSLKEKDYVEAARAVGAGSFRIIFVHLVPNLIGPVIVYATLNVPAVMLQEAFLSFLGLGVRDPVPSWGTLVRDGAAAMETYWWLMAFPGAAFSATLLGLNFLGDGLRDALDPHMAR